MFYHYIPCGFWATDNCNGDVMCCLERRHPIHRHTNFINVHLQAKTITRKLFKWPVLIPCTAVTDLLGLTETGYS